MDVKKCDRCGAVYEVSRSNPPTEMSIRRIYMDYCEMKDYDLCEKCLADLRKWVKDGKRI